MWDANSSRIIDSQSMAIYSGITSIEEGAALVVVNDGGLATVKPSAGGAATEVFAGFAMNQVHDATYGVFVEDITVPASSPYTVDLVKTPVADSNIGVVILSSGTNVPLDADDTPETGEFALTSTKTLVFHADQAGVVVRVTYRYAITVAEQTLVYGQGIGDGGASIAGMTTVATKVERFYTSLFDEVSNWLPAVGAIYLGAAGRVTLTAGSNTLLTGAYVVEAPTPLKPYLGLAFR